MRPTDGRLKNATAMAVKVLEILGDATVSIQPHEGSLDNPSAREIP
jgi:hypothetical protein